jgi:ATP-dependent RNA helicase DeaD
MENFRKLGLIEPILKVIDEEKFVNPTEIQEKAIPLALAGKDVVAGAMTGSGKTLVFGSAIIGNCERRKGIQALVLVPTRELCEQVARALEKFSKYKPLEIISVYGGVSINPQIIHLRTADVVVGTPGRILDHLSRGTINLSRIKILVLDEADRMLDMGFIDDVNKIISQCNKERQTLLFSATISPDICHIAKKYLNKPVEVSAEAYVDPSKLKQVYYDVPQDMKFSLLVHLLKHEKAGLTMVFCNTQRNTDFVARHLESAGIHALGIHGGFSQDKRNKTMQSFSCGRFCVLVCTDVAARGLDIKEVSHIYNYDIPKDSKDYIHRIGRTARAGKEGKAISILSGRDYENFQRVIDNKDIKIEREELPENIEKIMIRWEGSSEGFQKRGAFGRGRFGGGGGNSRGFGGGQRRFGGGRGFHKPGMRRFEGERDGERREYEGSERGGRRYGGRSFGRGRFGRNEGRGFRSRRF